MAEVVEEGWAVLRWELADDLFDFCVPGGVRRRGPWAGAMAFWTLGCSCCSFILGDSGFVGLLPSCGAGKETRAAWFLIRPVAILVVARKAHLEQRRAALPVAARVF